MTKHSKNNTASSVFSYAEYKKLDYGTKRQRLGNESMRQFDACSLCLQRARDPVCCNSGHLFCKECIYNDLLTQKKNIKRQKERFEALRLQEEEEKQRAREAARQRILQEFEKGQLGLGTGALSRDKDEDKDKKNSGTNDKSGQGESHGTKRKFDFDMDKVEVAAREAEEAAMRQIEKEQAEARKSKFPDFWLPSVTPTAAAGPSKEIKLNTVCRAADPPHSLTLKELTPVSFSTLENNGKQNSKYDETDKVCPSCKKTLSNRILLFLMKPCSHVVCKTCFDSLVRPAEQCVVCDKKLKTADMLQLNREGTGYAGGGLAESSKKGVAFQG